MYRDHNSDIDHMLINKPLVDDIKEDIPIGKTIET